MRHSYYIKLTRTYYIVQAFNVRYPCDIEGVGCYFNVQLRRNLDLNIAITQQNKLFLIFPYVHISSLLSFHFSLYGAKVEDLDCGLTLVHVNGDLFYLYPTPEFPGLQPGSTISCTWHQRLWNIAISDFFPNW